MKTLTIVPIILLLAISSQSHAGFNFMRDTGIGKVRQIIDPGHYKKKAIHQANRQAEAAKSEATGKLVAAKNNIVTGFDQDIAQAKTELNKANGDLEKQLLTAQIQMLEKMKSAAIRQFDKDIKRLK